MKSLVYTLILALLIFGCAKSPEQEAIEILKKSIEAHGGQEKWESVSKLEFQKWTQLLDENGNIESESNQHQEFRLKPSFEGRITWEKDSLTHVSSFDGRNMFYRIGDNEIKNEGFLVQKKNDMDAAFYVVAQPWKLLIDPGATFSFLGKVPFNDTQEVLSIQVNYGPDDDVWWYYFDPETFLMVGNEVQLDDHRSMIVNGDPEYVNGFIFHGIRESFRVDQNSRKLYLRARYRYSDYSLSY